MMKYLQITSIVLLFTVVACKREVNRSFGYGNFEATEILVSAQAKGEILRINIEEGQSVQSEEVVGLIDTTALHLARQLLISKKEAVATQFKSIDANLSVKNQQLENSLKTQKRIHRLFNGKAATQRQIDDIDGMVSLTRKQIAAIRVQRLSVKAQIKTVETQINQLNEQVRKCFITNPVTGTILVKYAEKGELAVPGKPLYKLADMKTLNLKAYISGNQLSHIKIGQKVKVLFDASKTANQTVDGRIVWVSSTAEFTPKTIQTKEERVNLVYAVKVAVKNDGAIKIGMPGEFNLN